MISFTVASNAVPNLKGFVRDMTVAVNNQIEADAIVTISQARQQHRFTTRTGNLVKSTKYKMSRRDSAVNFYIDNAKAVYGKFIHEGFKSWRPDRYLQKAVTKNMPKMYRDIKLAIDKVIRKNHLAG